MSIERTMTDFAAHIYAEAQKETDLLDKVKAFDALRAYFAILTKEDAKGDKEPPRRPTMKSMREKIALVSNGGAAEDDD